MKRRARVLLSTISTAAMTAVFGLPAEASKPSADGARTPIERLASIREAYLLALKNEWPIPGSENDGDQVAQFRNFPNFPNFSNWRNR